MSNELAPSPLAEAPATSLDELFSRDPLDLADADIDRIVAELRRQRANFKLAESQGKTARPRKAPAMTVEQAKSITLEDLGLG